MSDEASRAYWWRGPPTNFGDALMGLVAAKLAGEIALPWAAPADADVILGGSVLGEVSAARSGTPVWGAGFLTDGGEWSGPALDFRAARGPLTASRVPGDPAIGDPGVLVSRLVPDRREVADRAPVVFRHYADPRLGDVRGDHRASELLPVIASASEVVSSSLHGIIVAHAYGIPARWDPHPAVIGDGYKFADYALSVGLTAAQLRDDFTCPDVTHLQDALMEAWPWR